MATKRGTDGRFKKKGAFADAGGSAGGLLSSIFASGQAPRRGTRELVLAYSRLPYLHTAVRKVATDVASVPLRLYAPGKGRTKAHVLRGIRGAVGDVRRNVMQAMTARGDLMEVETHPLLDMLDTMNPALRAHASRMVTQVWLELVGDAFWVLERAKNRAPLQAWPVPPHWLAESPTVAKPTYRFSFSAWQRTVPEDDVLWLRTPDPLNPYGRGTSVGAALSDELDISEFAAQHIRSFFFNRAMPDVFLTVEGIDTKKEAERYEEQLRVKHQGNGKAFQVHVASGKMDVKTVGQTFKEQEMNALRAMERDVVVHTMNIPPECLGIIENSNRATIDSAYYLYARGVLCPRLDTQADATQPLADAFDSGLVVGYESPVPEDMDGRRATMVAFPTAFFVDEIRALAGSAPLPNGEGQVLFKPAALPLGTPPEGGTPPGTPAPKPDVAEEPAEEEPDPAAKAVQRAPTLEQLRTVYEALRPERLTKRLDPVWKREVEKWGAKVLNRLGVDVKFDMRNPEVVRHLEEFGTVRIRGLVDGSTRDALRATLTEGVKAGEDIRRLKARVQATFSEADSVRAERIARTEVVGSSNASNLLAYEMSGVVEGKEWLSVQDGQSGEREHDQMDGQTVGIREDFTNPTTGHKAPAPGQFGVAGEDINCRCTVLPKVGTPGERAAMSAEERGVEWRAFDSAARAWEADATEALRAGFGEQEADVLAALEGLA